jgi:HEAT repeat protein
MVKQATLKCLRQWGTPEHVPALVEVLADKVLRKLAIPVLGKIQDDAAIEALALRLGGDDVDLITAALVACGPKAEKKVQEQLTNPTSIKARVAACVVLAEIGAEESRTLLFNLGKKGVIPADAAAAARKKIAARLKKAAMEKDKGK